MEALKILQLADHSEIISGGAMQMLLLAQGLCQRGHEVTCVFDDAASPLEHTLERVTQVGARLVRLPMGKKELSEPLRALIERERFDVVHTHRATYKTLLRSCRDLVLPPVVVNRGQSRPVRERELEKLRHPAVRAVVVVAAHIRDVLVRDGVAAERVEVIYGSYDPARFHAGVDGAAVRATLTRGDTTAPLVGVVAKLSHYKSHDVFLEGAARVLVEVPNAVFAVVGHDPDGVRPQLEALAVTLGRTYNVALPAALRFTGPREDVPELLAAFDVSVSASASAWEGLSGVMRESLALGRPVVCTDVGGNRELVRHRDTGLLVEPGDAAALASAILELLRDPVAASRYGTNGRRLAMETFSNAARARTMEALYRRLQTEAHAAP